MRVRDHIFISTAGVAALRPWAGSGLLGFWAGSVLTDVDHYVWFCLRQRRLSPVEAVRFFNQAQAPQHAATRPLHNPVVLAGAVGLGLRRSGWLPLAVGMCLHAALDARHEARMERARAEALHRDQYSCRGCGTRTGKLGTHLRYQPWLLPKYRAQDLISLCDVCHEDAHAVEEGSRSWG